MLIRVAFAAPFIVAVLLAACGGGGGGGASAPSAPDVTIGVVTGGVTPTPAASPTPGTPIQQFPVSPATANIDSIGATATITATTSGSVTAASSNTSVATVSGAGPAFTITSVAVGFAIVTVTASSGQTAQVYVNVQTASFGGSSLERGGTN